MVFFYKERVRRRKEVKRGVVKKVKRGVWREY